jgi:transcription factor C subunit 7
LNWNLNPTTGSYTSNSPTPTGIPADPVLTAHGVKQSQELAEKLSSIQPPVDVIYSSPYYRCLQTITPAAKKLFAQDKAGGKIRVENGFRFVHIHNYMLLSFPRLTPPRKSEFYGNAHFAHPSPAPLSELAEDHFPDLLDQSYAPTLVPDVYGETILNLHDRLAYVIHRVITECDAQPDGPKTLLICTHAACMIAMGRILTGKMPNDPATDDFQCYTASLSVYKRRQNVREPTVVGTWDMTQPREVPKVQWRDIGVSGGWECLVNSDCSYLSGGEERGW